jgi:hypothetical protein
MRVHPDSVDGACGGKEREPNYYETITIVQNGADVTVSGIAGATGPWTGTFDGTTLTFGGTKVERYGTTTETFTIPYVAGILTGGTINWSTSGPRGSCTNGVSSLRELTKLY